MAKFARYGPPGQYDYGIPEAGLCLSSFAVVRRGTEVLLGRAREHPRWAAEWAPNFAAYDREERAREWETWRFPATFLYEGEHPDEALGRVLRDQLRTHEFMADPVQIYAFYDPSDWFPGKNHYDLCFVYDVEADPPAETPEWFAELRFVRLSEIASGEFGSAMGDLAAVLEERKP